MTTRTKHYHTLVLESAQLSAIRDGLELLKKQVSWARTYVPSSARAATIEPLDTACSEADWVIREHQYAHGDTPAACERAGCGWLLALAFDSNHTDADYTMPPDELLIKRVAELLDTIEQVGIQAKYRTSELAWDLSAIVEVKPGTLDDPESARIAMRRPGDGASTRPTRIRVIDWMTFNSLESHMLNVRSALRMLRKSQQKAHAGDAGG